MVRVNRIGVLLLAVTAVAGAHVVRNDHPPPETRDGFLAYGRVSVAISRSEVNTPQTRRCIASSAQADIDVRQGVPVVISLDGRAVGAGDLSTGELVEEMTQRGRRESRTLCQYKFAAPVTTPGDGRYTVDIGEAKVAFTVDELRQGINVGLT